MLTRQSVAFSHKHIKGCMNTQLKPWQFNIIVCSVYLLFGLFTMQVLKTLAVWPPAGVALAGLMLFGRKAWLGVASGTCLVVLCYFYLSDLNPFTFKHIAINAATTTGNTLAALTAFWLINRKLKQHTLLTSVTSLARVFIVACIAIGVISALFGVGIYSLVGIEWFNGLYVGILNWSISNALAAIVFTPALYFLWRNWPHPVTHSEFSKLLLLTLTVVLLCYFIFGPAYTAMTLPFLQPALLLFPLLYAATRLSPTATSCMNMLVFFAAWVGSNQGWGYFYYHHPKTAEVTMQFFFLFTLSAVLLIQAVFIQRKKEQQKLTTMLEQKVEERTYELERAKHEALALSVTDHLTQLYNRRGFFEKVNQQFAKYRDAQGTCSLLLLDLDQFKAINDKYGHATGDEVIRTTAHKLTQHSRASDIAGRIGGEEFVLFLPMANNHTAFAIAEKIRADIEQQDIIADNKHVKFTVSIGVSTLQASDQHIESMLKRADKALYQAKNQGRNQAQCS